MAIDPNTGWALGPLSGSPQSTTAPMTPQQVSQIQAQTAAMQQPAAPANQQQQTMMGGLLGQNLGSAGNALWGSTPAYGGGNILSGDAYGGSAQSPLAGLTAADYG